MADVMLSNGATISVDVGRATIDCQIGASERYAWVAVAVGLLAGLALLGRNLASF